MLESLREGDGNLHDLNLEGAFPEPRPYRPRELYAALKATPLYDAEHGQWNGAMSKEQTITNASVSPGNLLLALLVEEQIGVTATRPLLDHLKSTPWYDPKHQQWKFGPSDTAGRFTTDQLIGILLEAQLDPSEARIAYERFKTSPFFDASRGQWNACIGNGQELLGTDRFPDNQLLGVLAEARFNLRKAREIFEELKATPLYDAQYQQWNWYMSVDQQLLSTCRHAGSQLLGVLAEAQFNPSSARALYEDLKASPLYDPQLRQWNGSMSKEQVLENSVRCADDQLFGVLVEAMLLATLPPRPLTENIPPLPITKDW